MNMPLMLLSAYTDTIQWIGQHLFACPSKKYLHIECPGCGFQRSVIYLLDGRLMDSLRLYPATIPLLSLLIFTCIHLKYKFLHGAMIIKYLQFSVAIMILVFYIYKILNHKIIA
jgi:Protein of unknown function (DUF2752)